MRIPGLFLILTFAAAALCAAQPTKPSGSKDEPSTAAPKGLVRVQVEFIELPHPALTGLLAGKYADDAELRKQAGDLIAKKEANILETLIVSGIDGESAKTGSTDEFIYPTEYEPVEIFPSSSPQATEAVKGPFCPTAFETRNLGSSLQIKPAINPDGKSVRMEIAPEMVWHTGNTLWAEDKDKQGNVSRVEMPRIYTLGITSSIVCAPAKPLLIAALSPKGGDGLIDTTRKVMVFVKCDIIK